MAKTPAAQPSDVIATPQAPEATADTQLARVHILSDLTLGLGTVVYDYLDKRRESS
jgi:acetoacetate decarboxylase